MQLALIIVFIVVVVLVIGGRSLAAIGIRKAATDLRELRRLASVPLLYRAPTAADPVPPTEPMAAMTADLQEQGCVMLGDFAEVQPGGKVMGVTRWFRDATGSVVGWCGVAGTPPTVPVVAIMSETTTGVFVGTLRGPELPSLSRPAWFHAQRSPWEHGMASALTLHRQTLAALDVPTVQALTAAEAQALMNRRIERMKAWRATQPEDRLMEDDVRAVTGAAHADLAAPLLARLRKIEAAS